MEWCGSHPPTTDELPFHCAHPAEDVQVSQSWRLACPLRRSPFIWLTVYAVPLPHRWGRQVLEVCFPCKRGAGKCLGEGSVHLFLFPT